MICKNNHRYLPSLANLSENQGGGGRHACAGCAYEQGYNDAYDGVARGIRLHELNDSQAGTARHRDVNEAYDLGYNNGLAAKP